MRESVIARCTGHVTSFVTVMASTPRYFGLIVVASLVALVLGATCASAYARLAAPFYAATAKSIAAAHPWRVVEVAVVQDATRHGSVLRMTGEVRRHREDERRAGVVISTVEVGEVVETPVVFWALVLLWPMRTVREGVIRILAAVPVFLALEVATTTCQLLHPLAEASALLAGEAEPVTAWERWSRFLESGGHFVVEVAAALLPVAIGAHWTRPSSDGVAALSAPVPPALDERAPRAARR